MEEVIKRIVDAEKEAEVRIEKAKEVKYQIHVAREILWLAK
jgi:vacuolar-type H+-ATPase subunit H